MRSSLLASLILFTLSSIFWGGANNFFARDALTDYIRNIKNISQRRYPELLKYLSTNRQLEVKYMTASQEYNTVTAHTSDKSTIILETFAEISKINRSGKNGSIRLASQCRYPLYRVDIAISEDGPMMVEMNVHPDPNCMPVLKL